MPVAQWKPLFSSIHLQETTDTWGMLASLQDAHDKMDFRETHQDHTGK